MKDILSNLPLTPDNVTAASRIMLPTYVGLFSVLGVNYLTISPDRLAASASLDYADNLFYIPLWGWGWVFIACALILLSALLSHRRDMYRLALTVGMICMIIWAGVFLGASLFGGASPAAWAWPLFASICCKATERSLNKEEVSS